MSLVLTNSYLVGPSSSGQLLQTVSIGAYNTAYNLGNYPTGVYTIKYVSGAWTYDNRWYGSYRTGFYWGQVNINAGGSTYLFTDGVAYGTGTPDLAVAGLAAQTAGLGKKLTFSHAGGVITIMLSDSITFDNYMYGVPTYSLWTGNG